MAEDGAGMAAALMEAAVGIRPGAGTEAAVAGQAAGMEADGIRL